MGSFQMKLAGGAARVAGRSATKLLVTQGPKFASDHRGDVRDLAHRFAAARAHKAADREAKAVAIEDFEAALVTLHQRPYPPFTEPVLAVPEQVDRVPIRREYANRALAGMPRGKVMARSAAKRDAFAAADAACDREDSARLSRARKRHADNVALWARLLANERGVVLTELEKAFADNFVPAFAVDCSDDVISLVTVGTSACDLPHEAVTRGENGKPRFAPRRDLAELHMDGVFSGGLAAIKEAFAIAPNIRAAQLVCAEWSGGRGTPKFEALCLIRASRDEVARLNWVAPPKGLLEGCDEVRYSEGARDGLSPLNLAGEPEVAATLSFLAAELIADE